MIIMHLNTEKGKVIAFGLTEENLDRLRGGEPIHISDSTHSGAVPDGWNAILIFYGKDEREIYEQFKPSLTDASIIHGVPDHPDQHA